MEHMKTAADIVSAYVSHNSLRSEDLNGLIKDVHERLVALAKGPVENVASDKPQPFMPWKKTIHNDYLISLEDGQRYKTLKRHLTKRGMTVAEYREKWGLPDDYPTTAKDYSERRSALARSSGLGRKSAEDAATQVEPASEEPKLEAKASKGRAHPKSVQTRKRAAKGAKDGLEQAA